MRIYDLELEGNTYKACCGLRALGKLQKKYGSLKEFEKRIAPFAHGDEEDNSPGEENRDGDDIDIEAVLDTAKLFLDEGAEASGTESAADGVAYMGINPYVLAGNLFGIYVESMMPENGEAEKNRQSRGMKG